MLASLREAKAMANLSDHEIEMKRERAFRRGYLHGAEAIVQCIGERLLKSEREALSRWLAAELRPWATATHDADPAPPIAPEF
jgi:hypothetical protein